MCLLPDCKPGQRVGSIDIEKEWDAALLVLLNEEFDATAIYEADRAAIIAAVTALGSKAPERTMGARRCQVSVDRQTAVARALRLPLAPPDKTSRLDFPASTSNTHAPATPTIWPVQPGR